MILPLGTERAHGRRPFVTLGLIGINLAVFVAMISSARAQGGTVEEGAQSILERFWFLGTSTRATGDQWWRFVTYAFLHSPTDWLHVGGNMLFLWVFGPTVEDRLGHVGFSVLYLAGAVVSAWAHSLTTSAPLIGASGAVAAVTGAFMVFYPRIPIRLFVFFIFVGVYSIPAFWLIGFAVARDFAMLGADSGVSNAAHLGGYGLGISVSMLLLATGITKREPQYDLFSNFKHKQRLREFKAASAVSEEREAKVFAKRNRVEVVNPDSEAIATLRADVAAHLARTDLPGAAKAYRDMLARYPACGTAIILSRHNQLAVANALFQSGDHATALPAYRHFLVLYSKDPQSPHVRLMIGLIRARYIRDDIEARKEIEASLPGLNDPDDVALAKQLLRELGPTGEGSSD